MQASRRLTRRDLVALAGGVLASAGMEARAEDNSHVDLQLALAVDASGSVNAQRFRLQQEGYVAAFRDPLVLKAITSGMIGAIAVCMYQWTGPRLQQVVADWARIDGEASALAFAARVEDAPRRLYGGGTSLSGAIDFGVRLFPESGFRSQRRVIDVSGDGANTSGRMAATARDEAVAAGVVINGLPILAVEPDLDEHYQREVIGGPGSFLVPARSFEAFAAAVRRKLILEIAGLTPNAAAS